MAFVLSLALKEVPLRTTMAAEPAVDAAAGAEVVAGAEPAARTPVGSGR